MGPKQIFFFSSAIFFAKKIQKINGKKTKKTKQKTKNTKFAKNTQKNRKKTTQKSTLALPPAPGLTATHHP